MSEPTWKASIYLEYTTLRRGGIMAIAHLDPDGGGQFDKFSQKAEALLRRKRQEREEEIRREQREADAALVMRLADERRLELGATSMAAVTEHDYSRQDRFETAAFILGQFAGTLAAAILEGK